MDFSINLKRPSDYLKTDGARFNVEFEKHRLRINDLHKITDVQMHLVMDGPYVNWKFSNINAVQKHKILMLKTEGASQKEIAAELGCSQANVSKWVRRLKDDDYMDEKGGLTGSGLNYLNANFEERRIGMDNLKVRMDFESVIPYAYAEVRGLPDDIFNTLIESINDSIYFRYQVKTKNGVFQKRIKLYVWKQERKSYLSCRISEFTRRNAPVKKFKILQTLKKGE